MLAVMTPPLSLVERKQRQARQRIIDAARELFLERGFDGALGAGGRRTGPPAEPTGRAHPLPHPDPPPARPQAAPAPRAPHRPRRGAVPRGGLAPRRGRPTPRPRRRRS